MRYARDQRAPRIIICLIIKCFLCFSSTHAAGQAGTTAPTYPSKPIRIVTTETGSGSDLMLRIMAQPLTANLGQQVIIDNRGVIAIDAVAKAQPDGYNVLFYGPTLWIGPVLNDVSWDPLRDFLPVTLATRAPNILVVHPSFPAQSVKELIALAKAKPGSLNYASGSVGASTHLAAELFKAMAGVDIVRVNYKGGGPAMNAVVSGEVPFMFSTPQSVAANVKSGKLKAIAITSAKPSLLAPDLPTVAASGVPGYESASDFGFVVPAKTPAPLINRLNREFSQVLVMPDIKERLFQLGIEVVASTPQDFAAKIKSDMVLWTKLLRKTAMRQ